MASVSVSPAMSSPFVPQSPPSSPRRQHRRMPSRNPNAEQLPSFAFNPGAIEASKPQESDDENKSDESTMDSSTRKVSKPLPLPDFTFNPGASLPCERTPSPTHPILQEMALNQQRASRSARPAPLPPFTFSPYSTSAQPSPSPTKSTFGDMPHSAGMGHRRRGSEFVGGGKDGSQLISTSPDKSEYRPPPVSGPRGHSHRRSQAVSISDIETSDLIKANAMAKARAGSTPSTPSEGQQRFSFPKNSPPTRASVSYCARSPPSSPKRRDSAPGVRPRVGFSDRVDVIPRPLSLISSETEGSSSTVRGGHSLNGSINSIASPAPRPASTVSSPVHVVIESPLQRPKTADPSVLFASSATRADKAMSMISLPKRPLSASDSPAPVTTSCSPPLKKKHFWSSSSHSSPSPTPHMEKEDLFATAPSLLETQPDDAVRPRTSPERSASIKKRKYHTWTSGIFSKKVGKRSSKVKSKRNPTPPALQRRTSDKINQIFDADHTVVLREPSLGAQRSHPRPMTAITPSLSYPFPSPAEAATPVIDLDAAFAFGDEEQAQEASARTASSRIAKLHSSERRGNADAFGSFHKRAESAPMLQPVNRSTFGVHRMGSNSSLSHDVFDEEEEDHFLATSGRSDETGLPASKHDTEPDLEDICRKVTPLVTPPVPEGLGLSVHSNSPDAVVIVDPEEDPITSEQRSSKSTIEAPAFTEVLAKRPASSPTIFSYPTPSQYASSTEGRTTSASMISSPDPEHISFDNFPRTNRYLAEPSSDFILRASNEDLPSLSDSMSSGALPRMSSSANTRSSVEQRSASVCVPYTKPNPTAWKRASLASLNRLIPGSANGSKLKFETIPDLATEKAKKKTNRISKLMTFWRSKEKGDA